MEREPAQPPGTPVAAGSFHAPAPAPLPVVDYGVAPRVDAIVTATFSWWKADLLRLFWIGLIPFAVMFAAGFVSTSWIFFRATPPVGPHDAPSEGFPWLAPLAVFLVTSAVCCVAYAASAVGSVVAIEEHARGERTLGAWQAFVHGLAALARVGPVVALGGVLLGGVPLCAIGVAQWWLGPASIVPWLLELPVMVGLGVLALRLLPVIPVLVIEDCTVRDALPRTWALTRGHTATLLGAALVTSLLVATLLTMSTVLLALPLIGWVAAPALAALVPPIAHAFVFACYAACSRAEA